MDKDKKHRSGSVSNQASKESSKDRGRKNLPGAPSKSNRQTGGHKKDDSGGSKTNSTKKGSNSI